MINNLIPDSELVIDFARSGGPGGQNVNKVESKVIVRWNVEESGAFSDVEKKMIYERLSNRINKDLELFIDCDEERSQLRNREIAIRKINELVGGAIIPPKVRKKTRPSRSQKEKRLEDKKRVGEKKRMRKNPEVS